jgi:hypothetical protein
VKNKDDFYIAFYERLALHGFQAYAAYDKGRHIADICIDGRNIAHLTQADTIEPNPYAEDADPAAMKAIGEIAKTAALALDESLSFDETAALDAVTSKIESIMPELGGYDVYAGLKSELRRDLSEPLGAGDCLHGIENITRDYEGYIYYKGIQVEHYDRDYVYSEDAKNSLMELKRRCEFLENKGIPVSCGSAVWGWEKYADEYGARRQKELDALLGREGILYSKVEIYNSGREHTYFVCGKPAGLDEIKEHPVTKSIKGRYIDDEYEITVTSFIYGKQPAQKLITTDEIANKPEIENLLASCHDYLRAHDKLNTLPEVKYKTDFAEGYERTKLLDGLLGEPGRSLRYSEVFMYGYGIDGKRVYFCGAPTFDEIKEYHEYQTLLKACGDKLTVSMTTYQYGGGAPLKPEEMKPLLTAPFIETLGKTHYYLQKHDLSREIGWKNFTRNIETTARPEPEQADEYDCEP